MAYKNKIYHLCNISPKVIFRDEEDYSIAICRLAACAYTTATEVWAYAFMSTHFHLVVKSDNLAKFIKLLKVNIAIWHNKKYINNIQIKIGKRELNNEGEIKTAVNYVLKNPIHHNITNVAFSYPYTSAYIYFKEQIYPAHLLYYDRILNRCRRPSEAGYTINKKLFASHQVPDSYLIIDNKSLLPDSFVNVRIIEKLYSNVRDFIYNMNKPLKEELEMFDNATEQRINANGKQSGNNTQRFIESRESLFGKLTDLQVCKLIDEYLYPRTYTQITSEEKSTLWRLLQQKGVNRYQFERAI